MRFALPFLVAFALTGTVFAGTGATGSSCIPVSPVPPVDECAAVLTVSSAGRVLLDVPCLRIAGFAGRWHVKMVLDSVDPLRFRVVEARPVTAPKPVVPERPAENGADVESSTGRRD